MGFGFFVFVRHSVCTKRQFGCAAITVRNANHALDVMQGHGDIQIVPIGGVPAGELGVNRADGATGHHKVAVVVFELVAAHTLDQAHVLPAEGGETRVNTVNQHGFVITAGSETFAGRHTGKSRTGQTCRAKIQKTTTIHAKARTHRRGCATCAGGCHLRRSGGQYFVRHGKSSKGLKINKLVEFDVSDDFDKNLAEYFYLFNFKRKSICFYAKSS